MRHTGGKGHCRARRRDTGRSKGTEGATGLCSCCGSIRRGALTSPSGAPAPQNAPLSAGPLQSLAELQQACWQMDLKTMGNLEAQRGSHRKGCP